MLGKVGIDGDITHRIDRDDLDITPWLPIGLIFV
jgi:hypothetical protein